MTLEDRKGTTAWKQVDKGAAQRFLRDGSRVPCELLGEEKTGWRILEHARKKRAVERAVSDREPKRR